MQFTGQGAWRDGKHFRNISAAASTVFLLTGCLILVLDSDSRHPKSVFSNRSENVQALPNSPHQAWPPVPRERFNDRSQTASHQGRKLLMLSTPMLILTVGDGLFALIFLYIVLILICFVGCNLKGGFAMYIPAFLVVLLITLVLALAPKVPREELAEQRAANALRTYDQMFIPQTTIIVLVCFGLLLGLVFMFLCHCITPVYVRSLDD